MKKLELVLGVNDVSLADVETGETVWTSDGDSEFWEFIDTDFCEEQDIDEILSYLADADIISDDDLREFEGGGFDIIIEEGDESAPEDENAEIPEDL